MNYDYPMLSYRNFLEVGTLFLISGTDNTASPISNVYDLDTSNPALPTSSATGELEFEIRLPSTDTNHTADIVILGADRHFPTGHMTTGFNFTVSVWSATGWVVVGSITPVPSSSENRSYIKKLITHVPVVTGGLYKYKVRYYGLSPNSTVSIPEGYIGPALEMPPVDFGYDEYNDVSSGEQFESISGRVYRTTHYKRLELKPHWSVVSVSMDNEINEFREGAIEDRKSFWWAWKPDSQPNSCYLMFNKAGAAAYPIKSPVHRSFALDLIEAI